MIAWSAEGERRLRQRIAVQRMGMWIVVITGLVSLICGLAIPHYRFLVLGAFCWWLLVPFAVKLEHALDDLGCEETISRGQRIPGRGMLANKPRDTSRLTKWIRHTREEAPLGFTCPCWRPYDWEQLKWTANVLDCDEEMGDVPAVAVDPEGGRWVLLCECGIGHYMLASKP